MVWKHIQILREGGLPIKGSARSDYRINGPIDPTLAQFAKTSRIQPHYFFSTASTQTLAKGGAAAGLPEGNIWIAESQTSGRGRFNRLWSSGYGGLWISLLLRPPVTPVQVPSLTQIAAITLAQVIRRLTRIDARLKWPNDVVCQTPQGWRKLAGFLTEMSAEMDRTHWVIIGMGLNVNNSLPEELKKIGTSLHGLTGRAFQRGAILRAFLSRFLNAYPRWMKEGFEPFRKDYWKLYRDPDERVRLQTSEGLVQGLVRGIDASGALLLQSKKGIKRYFEGELA